MSAMQLQQSEAGEDLAEQFRKAVVSVRPLKGAQFFDGNLARPEEGSKVIPF